MGYSTKSVLFNGTTQYGTAGDVLDFERTDAFSWSFWFKSTDTSSFLVAKEESAVPTGWAVGIGSSGQLFFEMIYNFGLGDRFRIDTDSAYNDGSWRHAVVTFSGNGSTSGVTFYIDGSAVAATSVIDALANNIANGAALYVASRESDHPTLAYTGSIDEIAAYDKELTAVEVERIYNLGNPSDLNHVNAPSGLVAWWRMGESQFSSKSVYFAGGIFPRHYVDCGAPSSLDHQWDTDDRTYSFWCLADPPAEAGIMGKSDDSTWYGWRINQSGGYLEFNLAGLDPPSTAGSLRVAVQAIWANDLNNAIWRHIVVVVPAPASASTMKIYFNGAEVNKNVLSDTLAAGMDTTVPAEKFFIGAVFDVGTQVWKGWMDEVAIFSSALSAGDVTALYNSGRPPDPTGLASWSSNIGYWRMGDGDTYPTLQDSGNGTSNDGTMTNMASGDIVNVAPGGGVLPDQAPGKFSLKSVLFDGAAEWASSGSTTALDFDHDEPWSFSAWFKHTNPTGIDVIGGKQQTSPDNRGYQVMTNGSGRIRVLFTGGNANRIYIEAGSGISDGDWHHVLVTYSGNGLASGMKVYLDGNTTPETNTVVGDNLLGNTTINTGEFTLAAKNDGDSGRYTGYIDDTAVYDAELPASAAATHYNGGTPGDRSSDSNLVGYWLMGDGDTFPTLTDNAGSTDLTMVNGESGDIQGDTPGVVSDDLTLVNSPTIATDAPEDTSNQFASYHEDPSNVPLHTFQQDTFPRYAFSSYHADPAAIPTYQWQQSWEWFATFYFRMRATDITCPAIQQPAYVYWTVLDNPDWTAAQLDPGALPCGTDPSTDLDDIQIAAAWIELD